MDDIIKKIIEIDKKACYKKKQAENKKLEEINNIKKIKDDIINKWNKKNTKEIENIKLEQEKSIKQQLEIIENKKQQKIDNLNNIYIKEHEKWELEIFKSIINEVNS